MSASRWALCAVLACAGCKQAEPAPHRTEPWLAHPSASGAAAAAAAPRSFNFVPGSRVRFGVAGRKGKLSGSAPVSGGSLSLDARDLKGASGSVEVDLTKLSIDSDGAPPADDALGGASPVAVALQWLELGPDVAAERRASFATARFELASVDNLSAPLLDFSAKRPPHVRVTAIGTLLLHGFKEPVRVELALEPRKPEAGAEPRLLIRSVGALVVALAPHDITARGPAGIADTAAAARAADWVGKSVRIEFELRAEAAPPGAK